MSDNVVTCACGKRCRVPEGSTAKAVRCPGCKEPIRLGGAVTAAAPAKQAPAKQAPAAPAKAPAMEIDSVTCACGKRLRVPEGTTAKAVRCPECKQPVRLDGAVTAAPAPAPPKKAPPPAANAPSLELEDRPSAPPKKPAPKAPALELEDDRPPAPPKKPAPKAPALELDEVDTPAPPSRPPSRPAPKPSAPPTKPAPSAPRKRLIEDPPGLWLYVDDPKLIALADETATGRATTLKTFGPEDDPLADLDVEDPDHLRDYLSRGEYVVWLGRPSTDYKPPDLTWVAYLFGAVFALIGLGVIAMGVFMDLPFLAMRIGLGVFGFIFAGAGIALIVYMLRGGRAYKAGTRGQGVYLITNRRVIIWVDKKTVRSFVGPMIMNMERTMHDEEQDIGNINFSHQYDHTPAGCSFTCLDKCSEVEELIRGVLIDRVLEKSAAGDGPALIPMDGPNPFKKDDDYDDDGRGKKKKPRKLELWQAAALALEAEKQLTPEMIAAARDHSEEMLEASQLNNASIDMVLDEMKPGESVVWAGKPNLDSLARRAWFTTYCVWGGLAFVLGVLGIIAGTSASMPGGLDTMFIIILLALAGAVLGGMVAAGFYPTYTRWKAKKAMYVVTTRRALVWGADWMGNVGAPDDYGPRDLSNLHVVDDDLIFRTVTTVTHHRKGGTSASTVAYGFLALEDPHGMEKLIRETLVDPFIDKAYE